MVFLTYKNDSVLCQKNGTIFAQKRGTTDPARFRFGATQTSCSVSISVISDTQSYISPSSESSDTSGSKALTLISESDPGFTLHISRRSPDRISIKHGRSWVCVNRDTGQVYLCPRTKDKDLYPAHFEIMYSCEICGEENRSLPSALFFDITGSLHEHFVCASCAREGRTCPVCKKIVRRVPTDPGTMAQFAVSSSLSCIPTSLEELVRGMDARRAWERISSMNQTSEHFTRYLIPLKWTCCFKGTDGLREKGTEVMEIAVAEQAATCSDEAPLRERYIRCILSNPKFGKGYRLLPFVPFLGPCYMPIDRSIVTQFLSAASQAAESQSTPRVSLLLSLSKKLKVENTDSEEERATELLYTARAIGVLDLSHVRALGRDGLAGQYLRDIMEFNDAAIDETVKAYIRDYGECPRNTYRDGVYCKLRKFVMEGTQYYRQHADTKFKGTVLEAVTEEEVGVEREAEADNLQFVSSASVELANVMYHTLQAFKRVFWRKARVLMLDEYGNDDGILEELQKTTTKSDDGSRFKRIWEAVRNGVVSTSSALARFLLWVMSKFFQPVAKVWDLSKAAASAALDSVRRHTARFIITNPLVLKIIFRLIGTIKTSLCKGVGDYMVDGGTVASALSNFYNLLVYGHRNHVGVAKSRKDIQLQMYKVRSLHGETSMTEDVANSELVRSITESSIVSDFLSYGQSLVQRTTSIFTGEELPPRDFEEDTDRNMAANVLKDGAAEVGTRLFVKAAADAVGATVGKKAGQATEMGAAAGSLAMTLSYVTGGIGAAFNAVFTAGSAILGFIYAFIRGMEGEILQELIDGIWWVNDTLNAARALFDLFDPERCIVVMRPEIRIKYLPIVRFIKSRIGMPLSTELAMLSLKADIEYMAPSMPFAIRDLAKSIDRRFVDGIYDFLEKGGEPDVPTALGSLERNKSASLLDAFATEQYTDLLQLLDFSRFRLFSRVKQECKRLQLPIDIYAPFYDKDEKGTKGHYDKIQDLTKCLKTWLESQQKMYDEILSALKERQQLIQNEGPDTINK